MLKVYIKQIRGVSYKPADVLDKYSPNAIPIIRANNIQERGLNFDDLVYIDKSKVKKEQYLQAGDIVICASSGSKDLVGKAAFCFENKKAACGAFCKVVRTNTLHKKYLAHFFQSDKYRKEISKSSKGANINNIRNEDIDNLSIIVPSIEEQQRIADKLDKVSELIEKRQQQLDKLDLLIKSRFVEMFGDYDLRRISVEMEELSTLGTVIGGSTPDTNEASFWGGENLWITPAELSNEDFVINDTVRKLTDAGVDSCSLRLLPKDTVLLSSRAPIGKVAIAGKDMYCNQGFKNIICGPRLHCVYMYCLLKYNTEYLNSLGRGATFKEISKSIVEKIKVRVPPIELQNQFADFVEKVEQNKAKIKTSLSELNTLKKALMQKYFG